MRTTLLAISAATSTMTAGAAAACTTADITIKSVKTRIVNECRASDCSVIKGVAVLRNGCQKPVGIQVKIIGYDKRNAPVAARDLWVASINNIAPGDYTFSIDQWLDYDPSIKSVTIEPIAVQEWRRR